MAQQSKKSFPLNMQIAVAAKGKVYGPGLVMVPEHVFEQLSARHDELVARNNPEPEEESFSPENSDGNENEQEQEIPTVEELVKKTRSYLESLAGQVGITDTDSFSSKTQLATAIVEAMSNPEEEEEEEEDEDE